MEISNKVYDILKWVIVIVSPALITLITTLGELYGFESAVICGTISAITVFAGAVLQISSATYKAKTNASESSQ